jgi:hypothetical protein
MILGSGGAGVAASAEGLGANHACGRTEVNSLFQSGAGGVTGWASGMPVRGGVKPGALR